MKKRNKDHITKKTVILSAIKLDDMISPRTSNRSQWEQIGHKIPVEPATVQKAPEEGTGVCQPQNKKDTTTIARNFSSFKLTFQT